MQRVEEIREHEQPLPQTVKLTVIAQDPLARRPDERILTDQVDIPAEHLDAGPRGARLYVVDYDPAAAKLEPPAVLRPGSGDAFAGEEVGNETLTQDAVFRAQNVYAIVARTLAFFEGTLGRRIGWGFGGHQLYLVPRAFADANAQYNPDAGALEFGYVPMGEGEPDMQAALSHDIIAHETTHAVLDGLRPRFKVPGLPDQDAFHEALGDIVAMLSIFSLEKVVQAVLGEADESGRIGEERLSEEALKKTALLGVAEEFGFGLTGQRGSALRRSIDLDPQLDWRKDPDFEEPHRLGEVLVAATMRTFLRMWTERIEDLLIDGRADRGRVAEDGAKVATHLLTMMIRGIDYMPPLELEFEDVLDAVLTADEVMAPDDAHRYRDALLEEFGAYQIKPPPHSTVIGGADGAEPRYERMNYALLRADPDEVCRFLWENAEVFEIDRTYRLHVEAVRPAVRVGPDGLVVAEVVADYVQSVEMTAAELRGQTVDFELPPQVKPQDSLKIWGGGAVVFDQFGRAKFHQTKPIWDWGRQERRLKYLVAKEMRDQSERFGFSVPARKGQRFALLHKADPRANDAW